MVKKINTLFPLWAILASVFAYMQPSVIVDFKSWIVPLLILIMFSMGVTLRIEDFKRVVKKPKVIALTVLLQFALMPLAAFIISKVFNFSTDLMVGMILVGTVAGGTASNVISYLAKADVALSITMTVVSTLLSIIVTPYLTLLYVGMTVSVPALSMLISILKIVFLPVLAGVIINYFLHKHIEKRQDFLALLSIFSIVFIIAIVVGLNESRLATVGLTLLLGIMLHNFTGLLGGFYLSKLFGFDRKTCKTVAIEVGMQNSGLAVALAMKYFTPLSALPGAIFSIWHNISGSILASYWGKSDK